MSNIFDEKYWEYLEVAIKKIEGFENLEVRESNRTSIIHMNTEKYRGQPAFFLQKCTKVLLT